MSWGPPGTRSTEINRDNRFFEQGDTENRKPLFYLAVCGFRLDNYAAGNTIKTSESSEPDAQAPVFLFGDVAQLVERRVRNAKARGSNPLISTMIQAGGRGFAPAAFVVCY